MASSLLQLTGATPSIGGWIVEEAVGARKGLSAVYYETTCKESFSRGQQGQGAVADCCATCAIGPRPSVGAWVVELAGITGKVVSIDQYVPVCEERGSEATRAKRIVHSRSHRPLARSWVV